MTASRDQKSGEVILKVVNSAAQPITSNVQVEGTRWIARRGTVIVLTSEKLADENSIAQPKKVVPTTLALKNAGTSFQHTFGPYSLTVLRLKAGS